MNNRLKVFHLMKLVQECVNHGCYLDTRHALDRCSTRQITRLEILYVLINGYHEKRKDQYEERFQTWDYAIRGKTLDKRDVRVIVSFEKKLLIITAIDLDR